MYIVRWLMGHPIIATWFLGAIAILLSISNSGGEKDIHEDDHANNQEQVVATDSTKSPITPSALVKSDEIKATAEESVKAEVETEAVKTVEAETAVTVKVEEFFREHRA